MKYCKTEVISIVMIFLAGLSGVYAERSVAVLNIKSDKISPSDCISVTNFITSELRKVPGYRIIAWDDVTKMLEHQAGKQALGCDEDKCFAEIGGALGVDYVVGGDIGQLGSRYVCNLKLIDINRANTRNQVSETISGDVGALFDLLPGMVSRLLSIFDDEGGVLVTSGGQSGGGQSVSEGVSGEQARDVQVTGARQYIVKLNSNPEGAVVFLDGNLLCQSTPCSKAITQGAHKLRVVKEMYRDYEAELTVNRNGQEVVAPLVPTFGFLDVRTEPSGIDVAINGKPSGKTPLTGIKLSEGGAEVALGDDCYYKKVVTVNVTSGQTKSVSQTMQAKEGILDLRAVDAKSGDDVISAVLINGKVIGETPYLGKAPVCARSVVVKSDKYGENKVDVRLAEGQKFSATVKLEKRGGGKDGMVYIPGGSFMMGSDDGGSDEKPVHKITVSGFYMSKTEVTNAEYEECVRAGACTPAHYDDGTAYVWTGTELKQGVVDQEFRGADKPVVAVDWDQARAYCEWKGARLPTEAEWEYA